MSNAKGTGDSKSRSGDDRRRRLADELRANLRRRKARARGCKTGNDVANPDKSDEDNGHEDKGKP